MKIQPLADRVVVKQSEADSKTPSGIILPDSAKEKPTRGKVVAVGPGKRDSAGVVHPVGVKVNDWVYFSKYGGTDIEIGDEKMVIINEADILGILVDARS